MAENKTKGFNIANYLSDPELANKAFVPFYVKQNTENLKVKATPLSKKEVAERSEKPEPKENKRGYESIVNISVSLEDVSRGEKIALTKTPIIIGKSPLCDIVLDEEYISREHTEIKVYDGKVFIKDTSTNGTFFVSTDNGKLRQDRLPKNEYIEIKDKQIIKLANHAFRLHKRGV